jgi:hypothetical protein
LRFVVFWGGVGWIQPGPHLLQQVKRFHKNVLSVGGFPAVAALLFRQTNFFVE